MPEGTGNLFGGNPLGGKWKLLKLSTNISKWIYIYKSLKILFF